MVEYREKMIPHADWSFLGLGNGFGRKDLKFRAKGERESSWERERGKVNGVLTCGNSHKAKTRDKALQVRTIRKNIRSILVNLKFPDSNPEYPGSSGSRIWNRVLSRFVTRLVTERIGSLVSWLNPSLTLGCYTNCKHGHRIYSDSLTYTKQFNSW